MGPKRALHGPLRQPHGEGRAVPEFRNEREIATDLDPCAIAFEVDVRAVEAMLTNLVNHALDACRSDPSGETHRVRVSVRDAADEVT